MTQETPLSAIATRYFTYYSSDEDNEPDSFDILSEHVQEIHNLISLCQTHKTSLLWRFGDAPLVLTTYFNMGGDEELLIVSPDSTYTPDDNQLGYSLNEWTIEFDDGKVGIIIVTEH